MLTAIAVAVFAADQAVKQLVVSNMREGEVIEVIDGFLQWYFVRNSGAAFSMASGQTWILTIVALAVIVAVVVLSRKIHSARWAAVFGLVLGGALGNLFDRLFREPGFFRGHVVDYISTPWLIPAIYNIADMAIVIGMIFFVLLTILDVRLDGTRVKRTKGAAAVSEDGDSKHEDTGAASTDGDSANAAGTDDENTSAASSDEDSTEGDSPSKAESA